jgi:capsid assembly protease
MTDIFCGRSIDARRMAGAEYSPKTLRPSRSGQTAIIPVVGGLTKWMVNEVQNDFQAAMQDSHVKRIVFDIDSYGGDFGKAVELSNQIYQSRRIKKILSVSNTKALGGAYLLGTAAEQFIVTPSGEVGGIGISLIHQNHSKRMAKAGIETKIISAGLHKAEGNPFEPLSHSARRFHQSQLNSKHEILVGQIARNMDFPSFIVKRGFAQGRSVMAKEARGLSMVHRIATLEEVLQGP